MLAIQQQIRRITMASTVYFADLRTGSKENLFDKISRLMQQSGIDTCIVPGDLVAVKVHFGERGNHSFIRPVFLRRVVEELRKRGSLPFLTDSSTLYPGERKEAVSALRCAIENGFAYAVVDAPLIMLDGLRGHTAVQVPVDGKLLKNVFIGTSIVEADALVSVSHFKCHELTGFGGTLKNLGMGCASREGKMQQHSTVGPTVSARRCTACGRCVTSCAHGAISFPTGTAFIDEQQCVGCAHCVTACPEKAINIQWDEASDLVMRKMAEYALGAVAGKSKKSLFINFITQVSPACDCYGYSDAPIVNDIGICASRDPVALDQACADLVNRARGNHETALQSGFEPGEDKFRGVHPAIDWEIQLDHGEKIGLGTREYLLERL
jgi:uncharacterized protein